MKFLIDTNVLISGEPTDKSHIEPDTEAASRLIGLIAKRDCELFVHPASGKEIAGDKDAERRTARSDLLQKYQVLPAAPALHTGLSLVLGKPAEGSHDEVDMQMLSAVAADAVDFLITSDNGIHRRAKRVGLQDRVLQLSAALYLLRELAPEEPAVFPAVSKILCHELDHDDPFFDSLREDYGTDQFNAWIRKAKLEHRPAYRIEVDGELAGLALLKENDQEQATGVHGKLLKVCTFKIADQHRGNRYGELLLKPVFEHARVGHFDAVFCTCFRGQRQLITHLRDYGFQITGRTHLGEIVLTKRVNPEPEEYAGLDALEYHIQFGPNRVKAEGVSAYVVPIEPKWHRALFPELDGQMELFAGETPYGNSIRKAYLCRSNVKRIPPGSILLFYRSADRKEVEAVGVVEETIREHDPERIIRYVGSRTVYSSKQVEGMADGATRGVLAVLFRQARSITNTSLAELIRRGVVRSAPQSITQIRKPDALAWMRRQVEA